MNDRPNILYIFTDQQHAAAMSCVGNADIRTPNLDRLAASGVRFESAYCTFPLCTASRASMMTGRTPHEVGIHRNGQGIDERFRPHELGILFEAAGYDCVYGGKWHVPTCGQIDAGHGFRSIAPIGDPGLTDACVGFLHTEHRQPFLLVASFDNPHNICEYARQQTLPWGPVPEPERRDLPPLPSNFAMAPEEPDALRIYQAACPRCYPTRNYTPDDWRRYRHAYYRMVEMVDAQIGRILDALHETGLDRNTLVVFTSDHGDSAGEHQFNQKSVLYEASVRVPMLLRWPGRIAAGSVVTQWLVSNGLDLLPTLCDAAGLPLPDGLAGRSLLPLVSGCPVTQWRDHLVVETLLDGSVGTTVETHGRMVRTERFKYVVYSWGLHREQFYDLQSDPGEMVNLAGVGRFAKELDRHRQLLRDWCASTGDRFCLDRSAPGTPYAPQAGLSSRTQHSRQESP
jgi:arylsulfatase A-like enzyme